jgi:hypothetical protein
LNAVYFIVRIIHFPRFCFVYIHFLLSPDFILRCLTSDDKMYLSPSANVKIKIYKVSYLYVRFEVFTAVTMKNVVFWDVCRRVVLVGTDVSEEHTASYIPLKRRFV